MISLLMCALLLGATPVPKTKDVQYGTKIVITSTRPTTIASARVRKSTRSTRRAAAPTRPRGGKRTAVFNENFILVMLEVR
jgi:hypothetical protein